MKFKVGQVEIGLDLTQLLNGTGVEITIEAPIGDLKLSGWVSWIPKNKSKLQIKMEVAEVKSETGEIQF